MKLKVTPKLEGHLFMHIPAYRRIPDIQTDHPCFWKFLKNSDYICISVEIEERWRMTRK